MKNLFGLATVVLALAQPAFADTAAGSVGELGAGIGIGIAALGGALGQGKLMAAAVESISRNPGAAGQLNTPMLLGLAFIESLVIFALLVALKLSGLF